MKNKVSLIGHLGSDVEVKDFENGGSQASFSLATNEKYKDKDNNPVENTEWHRIIVNGELGKICAKYIRKGSLVSVEGKIRSRSYEKEGTTHHVHEIIASEVVFLDKKEAAAN